MEEWSLDVKTKVLMVSGAIFLGVMYFAAWLMEKEAEKAPSGGFPTEKEALATLPKPKARGAGAVPYEGDLGRWALDHGVLEDSSVRAAAFSPDGKWLVGSIDGHLVWWDVASGQVSKVWKTEYSLIDLRFSRDGQHLHGCMRDRLMTWSVKDRSVSRDVMLEPGRTGTCLVSARGDALFEVSSPFRLLVAGQTEPVLVKRPDNVKRNMRLKIVLDDDGVLWVHERELLRYDLSRSTWERVESRKDARVRLVRRRARQVISVNDRRGLVTLQSMGSSVMEEMQPFAGRLIKAVMVGEDLILVGRKFSERRSGPKLERVERLEAVEEINAAVLAVSGQGQMVAYKTNPSMRFVLKTLGQRRSSSAFIMPEPGELPNPAAPLSGRAPVWEAQHNRVLSLKRGRVLALDAVGRRALLTRDGGKKARLEIMDLRRGEVKVERSVGVKARAAAFGGPEGDEVVTCVGGGLYVLAADDLSLRKHIEVSVGERERWCTLSARGDAAAWWGGSSVTLFHVGSGHRRSFELSWPITGLVTFWGETDVLVPTRGGVMHASLRSGERRLLLPGMEVMQALPVSESRVVLLTRPERKEGGEEEPPTVVSVYDVLKGEVVHELGVFEGRCEGRLARQGAFVLVNGRDGQWVFETATGHVVMSQEGPRRVRGGQGLISDDGALVVEAIGDRLRLLAVTTAVEWATGEPAKKRREGWVSGSWAGGRLVMHSAEGEMVFLDPESLKPACELTPKVLARRGEMQASADGKLGAIRRASVLELWDLASCRLLRTIPVKALHAYPDVEEGQLKILSAVDDDVSLYSTLDLKTGRWSAKRRWSQGVALGMFWSRDLARSLRGRGGKIFMESLPTGKLGRALKVPRKALALWSNFGDEGPTALFVFEGRAGGCEMVTYDLQGARRWRKPWWMPLGVSSPSGRYQGVVVSDPKSPGASSLPMAALMVGKEFDVQGMGNEVVVDVTTGKVVLELEDEQGWVLLGPKASYQVKGEKIERRPYR